MPRDTDTSLFTSHVTQALLLTVCVIGLLLVLLILFQNVRNWGTRKNKASSYADKQTQQEAARAANRDLVSGLFIGVILVAVLVVLIVMTVQNLLQ